MLTNESGLFFSKYGQSERKNRLNAMLKPIFIILMVANRTGLLFNLNRANGIAVNASIPRIIASHKIYSGWPGYCKILATKSLIKKKGITNITEVENNEIKAVE